MMKNKYLPFLTLGLLVILLFGCSSTAAVEEPEQKVGDQLILKKNTGTGYSDEAENAIVITTGVSMRVLWTVSDYLIGKTASWGDEEAQALLFKPLDINETQIIFDEQTCININFNEVIVDTADYLARTWQSTPQELQIEDQKLTIVETNCGLLGFDKYMRLEDGRLIVPMNGAFIYFEPAVAR